MNIFILGSNGFLGKTLIDMFKESSYNVFPLDRQDLNLLNKSDVKIFFEKFENNIIINCAVKNGWRTQSPTSLDLYENILMHENLTNYAKFDKMICFSSGADSDRNLPVNTKECNYIYNPTDFYGLSKYITSKISQLNNKIYVLRIFNCFGEKESSDRFITSSILKIISGRTIDIWEDKFFDFFYAEDLFKLIEHIILNNVRVNEINCCYETKLLLSDTATLISNILNRKVKLNIISKSDLSYIGDSSIINSLGIDFIGIKNGIYKLWKHKLNV
jgi:GDP-L-fucose synthase